MSERVEMLQTFTTSKGQHSISSVALKSLRLQRSSKIYTTRWWFNLDVSFHWSLGSFLTEVHDHSRFNEKTCDAGCHGRSSGACCSRCSQGVQEIHLW